ncbi:MAG: TldD/PmbA family protein [Gammaproteobacteria bacterium]
MFSDIVRKFQEIAPRADFWSLRLVDERCEWLTVRQDVLQPTFIKSSRGAMLTVAHERGMGYAATSDLSRAGLKQAAERALEWARCTSTLSLFRGAMPGRTDAYADYRGPVEQPWDDRGLTDKISLLHDASRRLKADGVIVDWSASLSFRATDSLLANSEGARISQSFEYLTPGLTAVANHRGETQKRSFGYDDMCQGGLEQLERIRFHEAPERVANEAIELLHANDCPQGTMDVLLLPEQMMLQIHESIGHPLELDRILGDERNYAGTSFVSLDMFGSYRYGSDLLNVTFDPSNERQLASYGFDDEGSAAQREFLIEKGILKRPLGGATSQSRARMPGVANARACAWNRPAIDRMANLNVEPGENSLEELVARVENGVLMDTNRSWSIDDSRNKFQFGCEYGRLIKNGALTELVRNPNYRGVSATFWRSLDGVGDLDSYKTMGVPTCGKGEPNQAIYVGHASPACLFRDVEVFGGGV